MIVFVINCQCAPNPGILDFTLSNQCIPITEEGICLIGYDEEKCNEDDYQPFKVKNDGIPRPFKNPTSNPIKDIFGYKDGIESLVLKKGCTASLYKDINCVQDPFTLKSETNKDLIIEELSASIARDYGNFMTAYFQTIDKS